MTVSSIKVKIVRKPTLKVKANVRFPANIVGSNFLTITKANGTYTFGVDYTLLGPGPITDPTTAIIAILDQTAGVYKEVSLASLLTSGLDADLQAIAALTGTGILARTASNTWTLRAITGTTNEITVTNGDGVAGAPTVSLPAALTFTGKTITGGSYSGATITTSTFNGNTWTAGTGVLTLGAGKTATISNTLTFTGTDGTAFAFPSTSDTVVTLAAAQALTNKTVNGNTFTTGTYTLTGGAGKTFTFSNTMTLAGTDGTTQTFPSTSGTVVTSVSSNAVTNAMRAQMAAFTLKGNATGSTANEADIDVTALTSKPAPVSADIVLIQDSAASNAFKRTTVGALASAGSVSSIAGNTGAFTLSTGITNSVNSIQLSLTNATLQTNLTAPTGTVSTVGVMAGFGGVAKLTPIYSSRVHLQFVGSMSASVVAQVSEAQIRYGTGTAPVNGAALTGTAIGANALATAGTASQVIPFTVSAVITGLTPGTAYWFDLGITSTSASSTANYQAMSFTAFEF